MSTCDVAHERRRGEPPALPPIRTPVPCVARICTPSASTPLSAAGISHLGEIGAAEDPHEALGHDRVIDHDAVDQVLGGERGVDVGEVDRGIHRGRQPVQEEREALHRRVAIDQQRDRQRDRVDACRDTASVIDLERVGTRDEPEDRAVLARRELPGDAQRGALPGLDVPLMTAVSLPRTGVRMVSRTSKSPGQRSGQSAGAASRSWQAAILAASAGQGAETSSEWTGSSSLRDPAPRWAADAFVRHPFHV